MMSRTPAYDLRQGSFEEGWNIFLWDVRKTPSPKRTACSTCQLKSVCGQCPAWANLEMGDPVEPVDFLCQVAHLRASSYLSKAP
jgi:radical SAM protein with 4Fe4S-binding SPASM domain